MTKPNKIVERYGCTLRIYDNGGTTADRYTMVPPRWVKEYRERDSCFLSIASCHNPFHPRGVGMHVSALPGKHLGKRIHFNQLPQQVQKFARQEFPMFCPESEGIYYQSRFAPQVSIITHYNGWNLEAYGKAGSPLELLKNEWTRAFVMAEANDIVWPKEKHSIEVTFENGDNLKTEINGDRVDVLLHYYGKDFNLGIESDNMQKVVDVKFIE